MRPYTVALSALLVLLASPVAAADAPERRSTQDDQREVSVTVYNDDLALVKDRRRVTLGAGANTLAFRDVSARIRPESALLRSLGQPGLLSVWEQNFDFDLLTPQKLLEKYVGQRVSVLRTHPTTGQESAEPATVLAANSGVVLQMGSRIETGIPGRLAFDHVPANLRDRPTLVMQLENRGAPEQDLELSYLTAGLSWRADYVLNLDAAERALDLAGWVTLTNASGASYRQARLQLVAGDVNRVAPERDRMVPMAPQAVAMARAPMAQEALLEYHLYTLARPTTLAENQTKQVALLSAAAVPVRKQLLLRGAPYYYQSSVGVLGQALKVGVFLEFDNRSASGLGQPLPKGVMRVYKKDSAGHAQFVGEDRIDHTPADATVRLKLGDAFDVTADKRQTDYKKLPTPSRHNAAAESAYEIVVKNAKDEAVTVTVQEPIPGDWQMLSESLPHSKPASNLAQWQLTIPARASQTLSYRVSVQY
ncbi:MAG: DUF4139 domain-containing protein [Rhodoferax sp.]